MHKTLLHPSILTGLIRQPRKPIIFDTRFSLADIDYGRTSYNQGHIPGAIYADLDNDLSGPIIPSITGRHPLPDPSSFVKKLEGWGVSNSSQVVVYDDEDGGIAARLWWMLRWLGHEAVAVLDGGWRAWKASGGEISKETPHLPPMRFKARLRPETAVDHSDLMAMRNAGYGMLLDARTTDRYAGKNETIDRIAGHIPGAISASYKDTTHDDGTSLSKADLRALFALKLEETPPDQTVYYCGSGVTACRAVLAMEHAGLQGAAIYPGSWSEWINISSEIATGSNK